MSELRPRVGAHYPRSAGEFRSWFGTDADCLDYLDWLRWPDGFVCPECGHHGGWRVADGRYKCASCGGRTSVTAGTLFDRRRTPLTVWFEACWLFASGKDGMSALSLQRSLEIGSYPTAWAMLHRLRSVLVRPGRDRLTGTVEVDETYIGGEEPGLRGGRARGKKALVGIAVEVTEPRGFGRCRMQILADASAGTLHPFVTAHVEPGTRVITDGWQGYRGIDQFGYLHEPRSQRAARARGEDVSGLLPGVHRVASLAKRWLLGHPSGVGRRSPPAELPRRVRLPVQSAPLPQPRHALLPGPRTSRRARPGPLPRSGRRPAAQKRPTQAALIAGSSPKFGPATGEPTLESALNCEGPVN